MRRHENPAEAMVEYLTDCTLATVSHLSSLSRPPKHERERQISIAQAGVDFLRWVDRDHGSRVLEVIGDHHGDVAAWAKAMAE